MHYLPVIKCTRTSFAVLKDCNFSLKKIRIVPTVVKLNDENHHDSEISNYKFKRYDIANLLSQQKPTKSHQFN